MKLPQLSTVLDEPLKDSPKMLFKSAIAASSEIVHPQAQSPNNFVEKTLSTKAVNDHYASV